MCSGEIRSRAAADAAADGDPAARRWCGVQEAFRTEVLGIGVTGRITLHCRDTGRHHRSRVEQVAADPHRYGELPGDVRDHRTEPEGLLHHRGEIPKITLSGRHA